MPTFSWNPTGGYWYPDSSGTVSFVDGAAAAAASAPSVTQNSGSTDGSSATSNVTSVTSAGEGFGGSVTVAIPTIPPGAVLTGININGVFQGDGVVGGAGVFSTSTDGQTGVSIPAGGLFDLSNPNGATVQTLGTLTDPSLLGGTATLSGSGGTYSNLEVTVTYSFPAYTTSFAPTYDAPPRPVPTQSTPKPVVISSGNLIFSTIGILRLTSSLYASTTKGFAYEDITFMPLGDSDYLQYINSSNVAGAMEFLYNASLGAVKAQPHIVNNQTSFSSTYSLTSPWQNSWTINAGNGVLADDEINNFGFSYLAADFNNPNPVWQRKLSDKTCYEIMASSINDVEKFKFDNNARAYTLEVSNAHVQTSTTLGDNNYPYAWTTAYSPNFSVPNSLVPYIVKEDSIQASYAQAQYTNVSYPPKAYSAKVLTSVFTDAIMVSHPNSTITAKGTATVVPLGGSSNPISIPISYTANVDMTFPEMFIRAQPNYSGLASLTDIVWTDVSSSSSSVQATINESGLINLVNYNYAGNVSSGPQLPGNLIFYGMDVDGRINPVPETGWIIRPEGIKLLCDSLGNPVGFPLVPTTATNQGQQFASLYLSTAGNDATVTMGFYDLSQKTFLFNLNGDSEITYQDYLRRGVNNIYIGAVTNYQSSTLENITTAADAALLPHRWAMPVYSVVQKGSSIAVDPLPPNLGIDDFWPIPIRVGQFHQSIAVPTTTQNNLTTFLTSYQGSVIQAFYSVPEARDSAWSSIFGIPYTDVIAEEPILASSNCLQVRQSPILEVQQPTAIPSLADPFIPIFQVYQRQTVSSPWIALSWSDIKDFNLSTGEIFLTNNLVELDSRLFKIDYTTGRRDYQYKGLNLNPYLNYSSNIIDVPIYIYLEPTHVLAGGQVIAESLRTKTLSYTTDPSIFDPLSPTYDILALQLGVIYISSALDVNNVAVIDSRRRGGGVKDSLTANQLAQVVSISGNYSEFLGYWDINPAEGLGYQSAGFVIIRLPIALKNMFTSAELKAIIARNITAGVSFKIEDLNGNDW